MRSAWPEVPLGDVIDIFDNLRVPLNATQRAARRGPYPYYGAQGVIDHVDDFLFDGRYLLIPEDGENLNSRKLPIAYFAEGRFWVNNHAHIVRAKPGVADEVFVKQWLNNADIGPFVTGAAQPKLSQANLRRMPVRLPTLAVQRRIASILGAYDDLIEVNRRRISVLEEMARRLFDEWFVLFRFPGHEGITRCDSADLPTGWQQATFGALVEETRETLDPAQIDTATAYVGLEHLPRRSTTLDAWGAAEDVTSTKLRFQRGDILFGKIRPYFHKAVWAPFDGICSSDAIVWRPRSSEVAGLALALASSDAFVAHSVQTSNGTKMPRANPSVLSRYRFPLPPAKLLRQFDATVMCGVELAASLQAANQRLAGSRDLLLPRLISGDLPVTAAERELEAVA